MGFSNNIELAAHEVCIEEIPLYKRCISYNSIMSGDLISQKDCSHLHKVYSRCFGQVRSKLKTTFSGSMSSLGVRKMRGDEAEMQKSRADGGFDDRGNEKNGFF